VIKQRWPNYQDSIGTVCDIQAETQQLLDDLAALDYVKLSNVSENLTLSTLSPTLNIEALDSLTKARQKNVIRYWLRVNKRSSLPKARLDTFIQQLGAKQGANPIIENNDYDIRLYDGRVFIVDHMMPQPLRSAYDFLAQPVLEVPELNLRLSRDSVLDYLGIKESGQVIQVRFRTEESPTHQNNHRLKRLFQTHKVAPWLRKITPQLIIDGELIGIWTT
jgi:tRNA(Ile)-lysidine synthase